MSGIVLGFHEIDNTKLPEVGGKGVNLGQLARMEGIRVPEGFCVTTEAYRRVVGAGREMETLLDTLSLLDAGDAGKISLIAGQIRKVIESLEIPPDIREQIVAQLSKLGEDKTYAVRSSATAEDLPQASFAGQQDTYLNINGQEAILHHISKCWASLFTDRAVTYRNQNGFGHRNVYLSVIVQEMVFPEASGIMFTADPVTSNRKVLSIDAGIGLGEALVSGLINADTYRVREGKILEKKISAKTLAVYPLEEGGTGEREIEAEEQDVPTLTDRQILRLEETGRKIERYFGCPQDIEWCISENEVYILQSRPITTLYPLPQVKDKGIHVFMSMGHQQMMTDPIKPLGISFFKFFSNDNNISLAEAGGRLFVDLTHDMASPLGRKLLLATMRKGGDPLLQSALANLMKRRSFVRSLPRGKRFISLKTKGLSRAMFIEALRIYRRNDPSVIEEIIKSNEISLRNLEKRITRVSGDDLFDFILRNQREMEEIMYDPRGLGVILVGLYAADWINKKMEKWLGEKSAADTLSQSVPYNVTSEMGLALLDVADVVRRYPEVVRYFQGAVSDETFFEELIRLEGGEAVRDSMVEYLERYGMRCTGEIDITRPRWREQPTALIPIILSNIKNFEPGASRVKFERGRRGAEQKEKELISRLERLPGGKQKAKKTRRMISVLRNFIGYREYPKYTFIQRYLIYKKALLKEAEKLVEKGVIWEKEDVYYLSFEEFRQAVNTSSLDYDIIDKRKEDYKYFEKLTPPRIMTSEGEIISGEYDEGKVPPGALAAMPVSAGMVEGRARVLLSMEDAHIEEGDILVTVFTDPSWTPVFVSVKGLVTEVGGLMTHGAVIAREYGLPAVVGLENATKLIKDGQMIRVNGTEGYVELL